MVSSSGLTKFLISVRQLPLRAEDGTGPGVSYHFDKFLTRPFELIYQLRTESKMPEKSKTVSIRQRMKWMLLETAIRPPPTLALSI